MADIIPFDEREGQIWLDGKFIPWRDAKIHVLTHGLHYGSACESKGPMEKVGEKVDKALEKTGDKLEEAGEAIEDTAEKAEKKVKKTMD